MNPTRKPSRRSFLNLVIGGGALAAITGRAEGQNTRYSGVTDSDTGEHADRPGYGVGTRTQHTDTDTGPNADAQFHGRGPQGNITGPGSYSGYASGCSDSDHGSGSDPGGRGVHCGSQTPPVRYPPGETRHCTDSDRGSGADPVQAGRHC